MPPLGEQLSSIEQIPDSSAQLFGRTALEAIQVAEALRDASEDEPIYDQN